MLDPERSDRDLKLNCVPKKKNCFMLLFSYFSNIYILHIFGLYIYTSIFSNKNKKSFKFLHKYILKKNSYKNILSTMSLNNLI